jgi:hypothetical protein
MTGNGDSGRSCNGEKRDNGIPGRDGSGTGAVISEGARGGLAPTLIVAILKLAAALPENDQPSYTSHFAYRDMATSTYSLQ